MINSPSAGDLVSGIITVVATITDDAGIDEASVVGTMAGVNEFSFVSIGSDQYSGQFDTRQLGIGMVFPTVVVRAQDSVGNQSSSGYVLSLDNQAPFSSLDPPRIREAQFAELDNEIHCSEPFDPLGPEAVSDGEVVPQLFRMNVRAEDRGNTALGNPGTLIPFADIDQSRIQLFVLDDTSRALIVDTDGDGVCDSINPLLTPTSVPVANDEAAVINLGILVEAGGSFYRDPPIPETVNRPAYYPGYPETVCALPGLAADEPIVLPPVCVLQSSMTRIIELETSSKSALFGIPPINTDQCLGNAFDALATNISEGWACVAVRVEDLLGNKGISPPMRLCIDHNGDGRDESNNSLHTVHGCGEGQISPASVGDISLGAVQTQITAGGSHSCAITGGNVRCWGLGADGQLGYGDTDSVGDDETVADAVTAKGVVLTSVTQVSAGDAHTCARNGTSQVFCWGNGANGRLGYNGTANIGDNETVVSAGPVDVGAAVDEVSAGGQHTCALTGTNVRCWGEAGSGQLGYGNTNDIGDNELPSTAGVVNVGFAVAQVVTGAAHTCALSTAGEVTCWGDNSFGQLGLGHINNIGDNETPSTAGLVDVASGSDTVIQLVAGDTHTCALLSSNFVRCWGNGADGRLGHGGEVTVGDDEAPWIFGDLRISVDPIAEIASGKNHTCALTDQGKVHCWGVGFDDQLGYGRSWRVGHRGDPSAVRFVNLGAVADGLATGGRHTCVGVGGAVRCWGANDSGQTARPDGVAGEGDNLSNIGDIAPVWMRPSCTGVYDSATNTTDSNTPCRIPESFQDDPRWQLRRSDIGG